MCTCQTGNAHIYNKDQVAYAFGIRHNPSLVVAKYECRRVSPRRVIVSANCRAVARNRASVATTCCGEMSRCYCYRRHDRATNGGFVWTVLYTVCLPWNRLTGAVFRISVTPSEARPSGISTTQSSTVSTTAMTPGSTPSRLQHSHNTTLFTFISSPEHRINF